MVNCTQMVNEERLARALEATLTDALPKAWRARVRPAPDRGADAELRLEGPTGSRATARVEFKTRLEPAQLTAQLQQLNQLGPRLVMVADSVSPRVREILERARVNWVELNGDIRLELGPVFISREAPRPRVRAGNDGTRRYVADLFSGGALRIVRWLLIEPGRKWPVSELSSRARVSPGLVSRTLATLARDGYISRDASGFRLVDGAGLLEKWATAPPPDEIVETGVTLEGPGEVLRAVAAKRGSGDDYALTAEAGADRVAPFARYSRAELYVRDLDEWKRYLKLTPVPVGGNVVLIKSNDPGVFDGSSIRDGLVVVSVPQLYVDLVRRESVGSTAAAFMRQRVDALRRLTDLGKL